MIDYALSDDIEVICELLDITAAEFASKIGVSKDTVTRWKNNSHEISASNLNEVYNFAFSHDVHLNKIKEQIYKEDCKSINESFFFTEPKTISKEMFRLISHAAQTISATGFIAEKVSNNPPCLFRVLRIRLCTYMSWIKPAFPEHGFLWTGIGC